MRVTPDYKVWYDQMYSKQARSFGNKPVMMHNLTAFGSGCSYCDEDCLHLSAFTSGN